MVHAKNYMDICICVIELFPCLEVVFTVYLYQKEFVQFGHAIMTSSHGTAYIEIEVDDINFLILAILQF